jgi:Ca-activated chloride channel homolog
VRCKINSGEKNMKHIIGCLLLAMSSPAVYAKQVKLDVGMGQPVLVADKKQTAFLKVGLTGFVLSNKIQRTPTNIALVIDRSGSMGGEKIRRAREATADAVSSLSSNDIVSVVTYDDQVNVLVPATKVTNRAGLAKKIKNIHVGGSTALFAGVSKGSEEVRKFLEKERVNRVILLSDGLANVGPKTPRELGELGQSLSKEGISVSTIGLGLGYNEDLMTELARKSGGNHGFAENAEDLAGIFKSELQNALSVVAQEVSIRIKVADGVRPVKVLGRDADIFGQTVQVNLNQLYSDQEQYILLELDIPAYKQGQSVQVASVEVSYSNLETHLVDKLSSTAGVSFSASKEEAEESLVDEVMAPAAAQIAVEESKKAVRLRDEGRIKEAKKLLEKNAVFLGQSAAKYKSDKLRSLQREQEVSADNLDDENWKKQRKMMRKDQYKYETQQSY